MNESEQLAGFDVSDTADVQRMFTSMYHELRRIAARELRTRSATGFSPTTLVHETFLNVSTRESLAFDNRPRFVAYATRAMRGLLIDCLRRNHTRKRGGEFEITSLDEGQEPPADLSGERLEALHEALNALAQIDPRLAECVDLKFFGGFSVKDIARLWNVSERTVWRDVDKARLLLSHMMSSLGTPVLHAEIECSGDR